MASKKNVAERKRINQIRLDQRVVNAAYAQITGKSSSSAGLKMQTKIDAVLTHYGRFSADISGSASMTMAAQLVKSDLGMTRSTPKHSTHEKRRIAPQAFSAAHDFYDSWEWKSARFVALKRHGRRCQCCGWSPSDGGGNYLVVDHIKPLRLFPQLALDPNNHQVLCNDCNKGKSFRHTDDFRPKD